MNTVNTTNTQHTTTTTKTTTTTTTTTITNAAINLVNRDLGGDSVGESHGGLAPEGVVGQSRLDTSI
eukprot:11741507-Heterocapsa_arctica.AAC.1